MDKKKETLRVLTLDFGTSSIKAGIISGSGELLAWEREPLIGSSSEDFTDFDARRWLKGLLELTKRLPEIENIDAVGISGNGPTIVPADSSGLPLHSALFWLEDREYRSVEGDPSFFLPKAAWLQREKKEVYEKTKWFLSCPEFIAFALTGIASTFVPHPDFLKHMWTPEQIRRYGMEEEKFPPPYYTGTVLGPVSAEGAETYQIPRGIPVCAGGPDFLMALAGAGAVEPGTVCDRAGTSEGINYCSTTPVKDSRLRTLPHLIQGRYNIAGILASSGRVFEWFRYISGQDSCSYEEMLKGITKLPHEEDRPFFFPSLHTGATWEFAGGAFFCLQPFHTPRHLGRAVVEAIGFGIRDHIETLEEKGCPVDTMVTSGGQARNPLWIQMKADITGKRISVPHIVDAELLGNACAGMTALGLFPSLAAASKGLLRIERTFNPSLAEHEAFTRSYREYNRICAEALAVAPSEKGSH